ncbi:MAG: hypothetical protein R3337_06235, partial [Gammaproteobacteria bacterium]|nr:hypothetical protein [Gammaproteobacteria bacterium]
MNGRTASMRSRRRIARPLALVLILITAAAEGQNEPPPAPVVIERAEIRALAPVTWYPGTVISRNKARLAAEVAGRVVSVAEVGSRL